MVATERDDFRRELAQQLRVDSVRMTDAAGSGHPTSSMSAAELIAVLLDGHLRYDVENPRDLRNDHLIFSKGHASPLYYAAWKAAGAIDDEELLTYRQFGSRLEGHPTPVFPCADVATGSLGQGLPIGVGMALASRLQGMPLRIWVLCGDSEMAEGSIWEAVEHAGFAGLGQLTAIIDVNRLGQTGETMHGWDLHSYAERARDLDWAAVEIDGHDVEAVEEAYAGAEASQRPTMIVARTIKGKGVKAVEDQPGKHGKPLPDPAEAILELGGERELRVELPKPDGDPEPRRIEVSGGELPSWQPGEEVATRRAYGEALKALGDRRPDVVALDGEVSNSTYSELFKKAHLDRYFEMYIAEQQMIAAAVGMQRRLLRPFASTFAAFHTRAADFVRMAAVSRADICLSGSHAGVSIGEDGPSQMGLEDLALFRTIHGSTVLYPSDANQAAKLVELMADRRGVVYLRTHRGELPVLYDPGEAFEIGGSRTHLEEGGDVTLIGAGVTLHEALAAAEALAREGISARVIDLYSVKPIDVDALEKAAVETGAIVTVEDHWPAGGLGEAVMAALAEHGQRPLLRRLAVEIMPSSGKPEELLNAAHIDADAITGAARELVRVSAAA
jgi:transketolase